MKRGDIVTIVAAGDYGKPRPAVIVQSNKLNEVGSVIVCPLTTDVQDAPIYRLTLHPLPESGLKETSQIMVDKIITVRHIKCGQIIGHIDSGSLVALNNALALVMGIGE